MALSRRDLLFSALAAAPGLANSAAAAPSFQRLDIQPGTLQLLMEGKPATTVWRFGDGSSLPVVRAKQGETLRLRFTNSLDREAWLHFFGVRGPSELMTINVPTGGEPAECVFDPPDAGTYWIGPMFDVAVMREMGLYAMLIVEEREKLKSISDIPLVIDDWSLEPSGRMRGGWRAPRVMLGEGRMGNWYTVNGRFRPQYRLKPDSYSRLRILNVANARRMGFLFKGPEPLLVSLDGQPIPPRVVGGSKPLWLAPGQRADVLVGPGEDLMMAVDLLDDILEVARFVAGGGRAPELAENFALPDNPVAFIVDDQETRQVPLVIEGGLKGGLREAEYRGKRLPIADLVKANMGWAFNGKAGAAATPLFTAKHGEALIIETENRTAYDQPIHVHGHLWRNADLPAQSPPSDTAVIPAQGTLRLAMIAENPGTWVIQSLVAERADGGLLGRFTVE